MRIEEKYKRFFPQSCYRSNEFATDKQLKKQLNPILHYRTARKTAKDSPRKTIAFCFDEIEISTSNTGTY